MDAAPASGTITLDLPAKPSSLPVVRVFANGVGRDHGWDETAIEDLKLVLSELSAAAVESPAPTARIEIAAAPESDRLRFRLLGIGSWGEQPDRASAARRSLLDALIPAAEYEDGGRDGIVATFPFPA